MFYLSFPIKKSTLYHIINASKVYIIFTKSNISWFQNSNKHGNGQYQLRVEFPVTRFQVTKYVTNYVLWQSCNDWHVHNEDLLASNINTCMNKGSPMIDPLTDALIATNMMRVLENIEIVSLTHNHSHLATIYSKLLKM